jgi:cold shock CspA family protein
MNTRPRDSDLGLFSGACKFYNKDRGYGFITLDDGRECFFHFTGLQKDQDQADLKEGAQVCCRLWQQNGENVKGNGLKASEVRVTHLA